MMKHRILYSIICLITIMVLLYVSRPKIAFHVDGTPREFGFQEHQSIYSIGFISTLSAILFFYFFSLFDMIWS